MKSELYLRKVTVLVVVLFSLAICSTNEVETIKKSIDSLETIIGNYPPTIDEQVSSDSLKKCLADLITRIEKNKTSFDIHEYRISLATVNVFANNLDVPGSRKNAVRYYQEVIDNEESSVDAIVGLSALYLNSFNPVDSSSVKDAYSAFSILRALRKAGDDTLYPVINSNLCFAAKLFNDQILSFDAGYEYYKRMPKDSNAAKYLDFIKCDGKKGLSLSVKNGKKVYVNKEYGFRTSYSDTLMVFQTLGEDPDMKTFNFSLETPLTVKKDGSLIRNAISVSGWELGKVNINDKLKEIEQRIACVEKEKRKVVSPNIRSAYSFKSDAGPSDKFRGCVSAFTSKKYLYIMMYVATGDTFEKNFKYFLEFEKNAQFF